MIASPGTPDRSTKREYDVPRGSQDELSRRKGKAKNSGELPKREHFIQFRHFHGLLNDLLRQKEVSRYGTMVRSGLALDPSQTHRLLGGRCSSKDRAALCIANSSTPDHGGGSIEDDVDES